MVHRRIACVSTALALVPAVAWAQAGTVWRPDPAKPVQIIAADISINDGDRIAIFSGDVQLTQGDMRRQCSLARVYYTADACADQSRIDRVECEP